MTKKPRRRAVPPPIDGIPIDDPDAPVEGSDAGDATDLRDAQTQATIANYRSLANRHFSSARKLIGHAPRASQAEARLAAKAAARAFWWAEGTDLEAPQHQLMHTIGRWTLDQFSCTYEFDGSTYHRTCPIDIAHLRMGLSVGFVARRICSICGEDLSECPHMRDRSYWVRGGAHESLDCPVCRQAVCRHRRDRLYRVSVAAIVVEMEGREVSWVRTPANPEARFHNIPVPLSQLKRAFGPQFQPGMSAPCTKCRGKCRGFSETPVPPGHVGPIGNVVGANVTDDGELDVMLRVPASWAPPL